jgi:hypothetical protein
MEPSAPSLPDSPVAQTAEDFRSVYDIPEEVAKDLLTIKKEKWKFVCVFDDSGSMDTRDGKDRKGNTCTRWEEATDSLGLLVNLAADLSKDSHLGLCFLNYNGGEIYNISDQSKLYSLINRTPAGSTPLAKRMIEISQHFSQDKLVMIVFTDGEPDSQSEFYRFLKTRDSERIRITIMACTNDRKSLKWLDKRDKSIVGLDVMDDFQTEKQQVETAMARKGETSSQNSFSRGYYVAKAVLGARMTKYDTLDESSCCIIL